MCGGCASRLNREFPGTMFYFLPADIVSQTLNFRLPAPFDVQVVGRNQAGNRAVAARNLPTKSETFPAPPTCGCNSRTTWPQFLITVDRSKAAEMGLTEQNVANSVLLSLSGSSQVQPAYWLDPNFGIQYLINVRAPEYAMDSLGQLNAMPISSSQPGANNAQILANLASVSRVNIAPVVSHYNVMPVIDVYGNVDGRDLGGVLDDIQPSG